MDLTFFDLVKVSDWAQQRVLFLPYLIFGITACTECNI